MTEKKIVFFGWQDITSGTTINGFFLAQVPLTTTVEPILEDIRKISCEAALVAAHVKALEVALEAALEKALEAVFKAALKAALDVALEVTLKLFLEAILLTTPRLFLN